MTQPENVVPLRQNRSVDKAPGQFKFLKGNKEEIFASDPGMTGWEESAKKIRQELEGAMNARNVAFLLGAGCSSLMKSGTQVGIPTMQSLAQEFTAIENVDPLSYPTKEERDSLKTTLNLDISVAPYSENLEILFSLLYSQKFVLDQTKAQPEALAVIESVIAKAKKFLVSKCVAGSFSNGDPSVIDLYESFYRKLIYRDRSLPRPWIFTTNYDLFNETAMDRIGLHYANGFSGTVERRFNPATFRYALAEQLDVTNRKWAAVDSFVYLCKLHGSVNWTEDNKGLFPIREISLPSDANFTNAMIYPTPMKQEASFGSPYSDLFREFQTHIVKDQSVLFVLGYRFGDAHVNNMIFQALTVPNFKLIIFVHPDSTGVIEKLRKLDDPRIWIIGGNGPDKYRNIHYFDAFVEKLMPEPPGNRIETAIKKVLSDLIAPSEGKNNDI